MSVFRWVKIKIERRLSCSTVIQGLVVCLCSEPETKNVGILFVVKISQWSFRFDEWTGCTWYAVKLVCLFNSSVCHFISFNLCMGGNPTKYNSFNLKKREGFNDFLWYEMEMFRRADKKSEKTNIYNLWDGQLNNMLFCE